MKNFKINEVYQLNMEVFGGCNLACPMCPQGMEDGREKDFKKNLGENLFKKSQYALSISYIVIKAKNSE